MDFSLIQDGLAIVSRLDEGRDTFMADLARLREIIGMMEPAVAEPEAKPQPTFPGVNFMDNASIEEAFAKHLTALDNGAEIPGFPPFFRPFEAAAIKNMAIDLRMGYGVINLADGMQAGESDKPALRAAILAYYSASALPVDSQAVKRVAEIYDTHKAEMWNIASSTARENPRIAQMQGKLNALNKDYDEKVDALADMREKRYQSGLDKDGDEFWELKIQVNKIIEESGSLRKKFEHELSRKTKEVFYGKNPVTEKFWGDGEKIIFDMVSKSSIGEQEASNWAGKQVISKRATERLWRIKYPIEDVRRDMAEFYRITNGRLTAVSIANTSDRRAKTTNVQGKKGEKEIRIDGDFNRGTLWHEMGHHIEIDVAAQQLSMAYLENRRESDKLHKLKKLVPDSTYGNGEVAYKDDFIDPYIGKFYGDGSTEVFSMGMEMLSNPGRAALFAARDRQMFDMITGYLSVKEMLPSTVAALEIHGIDTDDRLKKEESASTEINEILDQAGSGVTITMDDKYDDPKITNKDELRAYAFEREDVEYIGSYGLVMVFKGRFRSFATGKKGKGYMLVLMMSDAVGHRSRRDLSLTSAPVHKPLSELRKYVGYADILARDPAVKKGAVDRKDQSWFHLMRTASKERFTENDAVTVKKYAIRVKP